MGSGGSRAGDGESLQSPLLEGTTHYNFPGSAGHSTSVELPTPRRRSGASTGCDCCNFACCFGRKDTITNDIDRLLRRDKNYEEKNCKKLLLLGAGGSGKSTIFKQLKSIHGGVCYDDEELNIKSAEQYPTKEECEKNGKYWGAGISTQERRSYKSIVIGNVIDFMKTLVQKSREMSDEIPACQMSQESLKFAEIISQQEDNFYPKALDVELAEAIAFLWKDKGILSTFDERSRFQMQDSAQYFFDERMDAIKNYDYIPNEADVLRARVRTTGIIEQEFKVKDHTFRVFDVGGQRNERKKWIHCFENVTGVIFVAALSAYDQVLLEDQNTNRMKEALDLFAQCNDSTGRYGSERTKDGNIDKDGNVKKFNQIGKWFTETAMILFLNKSDLFETKIERKALNACPYFTDYKYPMFSRKATKKNDKQKTQMSRNDDGIEYIKWHFLERNQTMTFTGHKKNIYQHVTNATDKNIIRKVFNDVQHILISQSLGEAGIM